MPALRNMPRISKAIIHGILCEHNGQNYVMSGEISSHFIDHALVIQAIKIRSQYSDAVIR